MQRTTINLVNRYQIYQRNQSFMVRKHKFNYPLVIFFINNKTLRQRK